MKIATINIPELTEKENDILNVIYAEDVFEKFSENYNDSFNTYYNETCKRQYGSNNIVYLMRVYCNYNKGIVLKFGKTKNLYKRRNQLSQIYKNVKIMYYKNITTRTNSHVETLFSNYTTDINLLNNSELFNEIKQDILFNENITRKELIFVKSSLELAKVLQLLFDIIDEKK